MMEMLGRVGYLKVQLFHLNSWGRAGAAHLGRGMTLGTMMIELAEVKKSIATRPNGLDGDKDEKAPGEEGQNGAS